MMRHSARATRVSTRVAAMRVMLARYTRALMILFTLRHGEQRPARATRQRHDMLRYARLLVCYAAAMLRAVTHDMLAIYEVTR